MGEAKPSGSRVGKRQRLGGGKVLGGRRRLGGAEAMGNWGLQVVGWQVGCMKEEVGRPEGKGGTSPYPQHCFPCCSSAGGGGEVEFKTTFQSLNSVPGKL